MDRTKLNKLSNLVIGAAIEVHQELGPGLLESVYEHCLLEELRILGLIAENQVRLPVIYKGKMLNKDFFIDIIVEQELVLELKCVEVLLPVHEVQLLTYLRLTNKRLGLLLNFNVPKMRDGIKRKVNNF